MGLMMLGRLKYIQHCH